MQNELFELYSHGKLKPIVMRAFPADKFVDVLSLVRNDKVGGKVVMTTCNNKS